MTNTYKDLPPEAIIGPEVTWDRLRELVRFVAGRNLTYADGLVFRMRVAAGLTPDELRKMSDEELKKAGVTRVDLQVLDEVLEPGLMTPAERARRK
jgi:hypothetical protein